MSCAVYFTLVTYILFFFFLMIRRPPRSTLFPSRRSSDLEQAQTARLAKVESQARDSLNTARTLIAENKYGPCSGNRSEEHTSELQSHHDLVCRLLLEKKKKKKKTN